MLPERTIRLAELSSRDLPEASRLASRVFGASAFYRELLGFDGPRFAAYWTLFLELALSDPGARSYVLTDLDRVVGLAVVGRPGFPAPHRGVMFLARLVRSIGLRPTIRYLRFVITYERAMTLPVCQRDRAVRGLWILVDPDRRRLGLGARLVRDALRRLAVEGLTVVTAFVDGSDDRLIAFYRHLGFTVSEPFRAHGQVAVRIDRDPDGRA